MRQPTGPEWVERWRREIKALDEAITSSRTPAWIAARYEVTRNELRGMIESVEAAGDDPDRVAVVLDLIKIRVASVRDLWTRYWLACSVRQPPTLDS